MVRPVTSNGWLPDALTQKRYDGHESRETILKVGYDLGMDIVIS